ncbi:MAG: hypothetical protein IPF59_04735 [Ignavibacteria bacterium]|nr:hypothetical protein [Ignavibacteria bacterium]MBK6419631.1 hypothetical protein [Ignavibacteria bacterium]MBK7413430.1 hypothetical protein [Ignavibacteria bacterium]
MRTVYTVAVSFLFIVSTAISQLPRVGSTVHKNVQTYFGIARRFDPMDSLRVVRTNNVYIIGMRNGLDVDTITFTSDEIPILERYLNDYEKLLASKTDAFVNDSALRRILGRVVPVRYFNSRVKPVSVRTMNGVIKTGIPLIASDDCLLLSDSSVFSPQLHLQTKAFTCIPSAQIETLSKDASSGSPIWYRVEGNVQQFRTAVELTCPERAYLFGIPPEFVSCIAEPQEELGPGASYAIVCPRRTGSSFAAFGGFLSTRKAPEAVVKSSSNGSNGTPLTFQPLMYSFGLDASIAMGPSFDVGLRGTISAQPPTIDDLTLQNSLGMDEYLLQVLGTWHILALDDIGFRTFGVTTTLGLGPSFLSYRTRTYVDSTNVTSTGSGIAIDATWNLQVMCAISRSIAFGIRGTATYQLGLTSDFDDIKGHDGLGLEWMASFNISDQSAAYLGAQLVVSYTLP